MLAAVWMRDGKDMDQRRWLCRRKGARLRGQAERCGKGQARRLQADTLHQFPWTGTVKPTAPLTATTDSCLVHSPSLKILPHPLFVADSNLSFGPSPQVKGWPPLPDFRLTPRPAGAARALCHELVTIHLLLHVASFPMGPGLRLPQR